MRSQSSCGPATPRRGATCADSDRAARGHRSRATRPRTFDRPTHRVWLTEPLQRFAFVVPLSRSATTSVSGVNPATKRPSGLIDTSGQRWRSEDGAVPCVSRLMNTCWARTAIASRGRLLEDSRPDRRDLQDPRLRSLSSDGLHSRENVRSGPASADDLLSEADRAEVSLTEQAQARQPAQGEPDALSGPHQLRHDLPARADGERGHGAPAEPVGESSPARVESRRTHEAEVSTRDEHCAPDAVGPRQRQHARRNASGLTSAMPQGPHSSSRRESRYAPRTSNAFTPSLLLEHTVRRFGPTTKKAGGAGYS